MLYLDYAANTPVDPKVLERFVQLSTEYIANPNAAHALGQAAKVKLDTCTQQMADLLGVKPSEIIYTSGATESNNLAIIGGCHYYKRYGKHIITTYLEHSSVSSTATALHNEGYEIEFVDILPNGQMDLEHLKSLLRADTIMVAISEVDSELGARQPLQAIRDLLDTEYPHCLLHVDGTQAIGKLQVPMACADLLTFSSHKFYGLNGCGVLIKKEHVMLEPIIHGGTSTTAFRSGTPTLALVGSLVEALSLAQANQSSHFNYVEKLNQRLRAGLAIHQAVTFNSPVEGSPYILNISLTGIKAREVQERLAEREIYVATKSACCTLNSPSRPVYAVTKDRKKALSTLRISLSHLTTEEEIETFLKAFGEVLATF
ncbi:MAG: cysteine desulfurase family protein [Niameybacter sp.]